MVYFNITFYYSSDLIKKHTRQTLPDCENEKDIRRYLSFGDTITFESCTHYIERLCYYEIDMVDNTPD